MVYSGLYERLNTLLRRASTAFYLHASNPRVQGNDAESLRQWCAGQQIRNLVVEQNPVVAASLLPTTPELALPNGLPLVPAGVRFAVDESALYAVDLSAEVAGITFTVSAPGVPAFSPPVVSTTTRTSTSFKARVDELYTVKLFAGSSYVATVLVPINRAVLRMLRAWLRQGAYQFEARLPDPRPEYVALVAMWSAANDAAAVGNAQLYYDLLAAIFATVPAAPTPTAVYPHPHA